MTHGKTYNKSPRRINHKATKSKTNTGTTALEQSVEKPRNRRFVRRQRREKTSKTANDIPVVNLSSIDLTESENLLLSNGLGFCPRPKSYDRGNLLHDTKVFSRRMRLKSPFNDRDDTNRSSKKYLSFVLKSDWQPPKTRS